jgi:hypothetical protein
MKQSIAAKLFILGTLGAQVACGSAPNDELRANSLHLDTVRAKLSILPVEKDLALLFDKNNSDLVLATTSLDGEEILAQDWYEATQRAFDAPTAPGRNAIGRPFTSSAAGSISTENVRDEWRNVSARVEPCAPLGIAPFQKASILCWPEVRLVMQPLKASFARIASYADDRGIHLLYDVPGTSALTQGELQEAESLKASVTAAVTAGTWQPETTGPLTSEQEARFVELRNKVASAVVADSVALRDSSVPVDSYVNVGIRPELKIEAARTAFMNRYASFLTKYVRRASIKQLAAMSLSVGRQTQPEWAGSFVSLRPSATGLVREPLGIASPSTGRELLATRSVVANVNIGSNNGGATLFDYQLIASDRVRPQGPEGSELEKITFAGSKATGFVAPTPTSREFAEVKARIADRAQVLVPNSSCGSCHALQQDSAFAPGGKIEDASNFHNLSYFSVSYGDQRDTGFLRLRLNEGSRLLPGLSKMSPSTSHGFFLNWEVTKTVRKRQLRSAGTQ